jgi:hypothetical protein
MKKGVLLFFLNFFGRVARSGGGWCKKKKDFFFAQKEKNDSFVSLSLSLNHATYHTLRRRVRAGGGGSRRVIAPTSRLPRRRRGRVRWRVRVDGGSGGGS